MAIFIGLGFTKARFRENYRCVQVLLADGVYAHFSARAEAVEMDAKYVRGDGRGKRICPVGEVGVRGNRSIAKMATHGGQNRQFFGRCGHLAGGFCA